ncbi:MAG: HD domain-containing phosphohydrolase [Thermodesulfobacteriota bacterium]
MQAAARTIEQIKVMFIDDDDYVRDAISELLGLKGWVVDAYGDAEEALVALKGGGYDVVLADINMPGLNGMNFLLLAREQAPQVPVVMVTGYPSIDLAVEAMKIGAVDFIAKPFKMEELEIVVRKAVSGARVSGQKSPGPEGRLRVIGKLPEVARRRLEDKIKELSILHTISETLDDVNEKQEIFRKTMDLAQIITDADRAFILMVNKDDERLVVRASSGYKSDITGKSFSIHAEPFKGVIKNRSYSYIMAQGPELAPLMCCNSGPAGRVQMMLAPMLINKEVVVMLGLTCMENSKDISSDMLSLVLNLTAKASLKLENIALSENIFSSIIGTLNSLINALDARDTYTKDHSHRVTQYALTIARQLGCSQEVIDSISFAGPLHDIGKIGVRDEILLKKGVFTTDEREIMKSHVVRGEEILRPLNLLSSEKAVVLYHHEKWDGSGYPNGLAKQKIPVVARIFSVADTFDAMTSTRPYRKALSPDVARDEIIRCVGTQFDPEVVDAFLESEILKGKQP